MDKPARRVRTLGQQRVLQNHDLRQALELLCGFYEGNPPRLTFLKDEREARHALARLLCSDEPLDAEVREMLATLIAPGPAKAPRSERILKFGHRGRQRRSDGFRNRWIAHQVLTKVSAGSSVERAILDVADEIFISEGAVKKIWSRYGKMVAALCAEANPIKG